MTLTEEQLDALLRSLSDNSHDSARSFSVLKELMSEKQANIFAQNLASFRNAETVEREISKIKKEIRAFEALRAEEELQDQLARYAQYEGPTFFAWMNGWIRHLFGRDERSGEVNQRISPVPKKGVNLVGDFANRSAGEVDYKYNLSPGERLRHRIEVAGTDREMLNEALREVLDERWAREYAIALSDNSVRLSSSAREEIIAEIEQRSQSQSHPTNFVDDGTANEKTIELLQKQGDLADKERENLDMEMMIKKQRAKESFQSSSPPINLLNPSPQNAGGSILGGASDFLSRGGGKGVAVGAAISAVGNGGLSLPIIIGLLLDVVDGFGSTLFAFLPGASDFVIGGILTAILLVYALLRGVFLPTFWIIILLQLGDAVIGSVPGLGDVLDIGLVTNTVCMGIIDRAIEKKEAEGKRTPGPSWNIFSNPDGSPTYVSVAFFTMAIASAIYGAWDGNMQYFLVAGGMLLILLLAESFRKEFISLQGLFLIISLVIHLFFMASILQNGFSTNLLILAFVCYFALAMLYLLAVYFTNPQSFRHEMSSAIVATVVTVFFYSLRLILDFAGIGNPQMQYFASFIALALPMWPLVMMERMRRIHPDGYSAKFFKLYVVLLVLIGVIFLINGLLTIAITLPSFTGSNDAKAETKGFGETIGKSLENLMKKVHLISDDIKNPGERFTGQVDANQEKPQGITQTAVVQEKEVSNTSAIVVNVNVKGESFIGESVYVVPSCYMDRKDPPPSSWEPAQMELIYGLSSSFTCTIGGNGVELPRGSAQVKTSVQFPFETWAYIRHTFVDAEFARNVGSKGDDIYSILGITEEPESISTDAPIIINMGGTPQPIPLELEKTPIVPAGKKIGLTLDSAWGSGQLLKVHSIELKVPQPFSLKQESCTRPVTFVGQDPDEPLLTRYLFENQQEDILQTYTTITCDLEIEDAKREEAKSMLFGASDNMLQRSFIAIAKYEYVIEEEVQVRVR